MRQTIPHFEALTYGIESTFKQRYTVLKSTILLHKRAKRRFHVTVAVF